MNPKPIVTDTYDFPTLVGRGYVYVDKTALLHRLISGVDGTCFFLSRPRRFGKSLMLSTLASIFNGEKKLFKGLDIARSKYDWKKYPTIRLDMSAVKARNADEYRDVLCGVVESEARALGVELKLRNEAEAKRYFLLFMKMAGADIAVESESAKGRADAVLVSAKAVHIFEFKYGKSARAALKQIDENGYAMPYAADRRKVVCIGLNYNGRTASFDAPLIVEAINGKVNEPVNEPVNESALLATVRAHPGLRRPQLLKLVRIREATMKRQLASLAADNLIEFRGAPKNGGYYIKA